MKKIKKEHKNRFEFAPQSAKAGKKVTMDHETSIDKKENKHPHGKFYGKNRWFPQGS